MNRAKIIRLIDLTLFVLFALIICSGLIIYFNASSPFLMSVYDIAVNLTLILLAVNILLNWRWILFIARKFYRRRKAVKEGEVIEANYFPLE